jgi:hypothetical protein
MTMEIESPPAEATAAGSEFGVHSASLSSAYAGNRVGGMDYTRTTRDGAICIAHHGTHCKGAVVSTNEDGDAHERPA